MVTVTDAQTQADALSALISSLTSANQASVRPQIRTAALTLQSMLFSLATAAAETAKTAAASSLDALIDWSASALLTGHTREQVLQAAISCQPINGLVGSINGWSSNVGTLEWNCPPPNLPIGIAGTPEAVAALLIGYLASYRSITGT
jgi:hypothetical protein